MPLKDPELDAPVLDVLDLAEFDLFVRETQDELFMLLPDPLSGIGLRLLRLCGSKKLTQVPILASLLIYDGNAFPRSR